MKYTLAHVTHEAVEKIGGIGTVLEGLITSPVYQEHVGRTVLIGPLATHLEVDPRARLGEEGTVLYSSIDDIDLAQIGPRLRPIEWAFNTPIVYGTRGFRMHGEERTGRAEVLMIDVFRINKQRLSIFKHQMAERFGIDSYRYEADWGYEEYVRLAEPAFYALNALLADGDAPCIIFSHEFMGLGTAFKAVLEGHRRFRTVFHAHECSTARHIVEHHPGHDTMFYNVMRKARQQGQYVEEVFGRLDDNARHALISRAHLCDAVIAVGHYTAQEMHFLGRHFDHHKIDLVYNGVPTMPVTPERRERCRDMLADYAQALLGYRPDVLMTHVMRPVISKGLWRDLAVCHELDRRFAETGRSGVLFILTSAGGVRRPQDIRHMEKEYGWPRKHRQGFPDLVGPEEEFDALVEAFNRDHTRVQAVLVNQFGWSRERIGSRVPAGMEMAELRCGTDVEFGMATYEPFGISPLEPLCAGAVCVISNVCGCAGFVEEVTGGDEVPNVLVGDYTAISARGRPLESLLSIAQRDRDLVEQRVASHLADELIRRLPRTADERSAMLESGQKLAHEMGWDRVMQRKILPMLKRIANGKR